MFGEKNPGCFAPATTHNDLMAVLWVLWIIVVVSSHQQRRTRLLPFILSGGVVVDSARVEGVEDWETEWSTMGAG